MSKPRMCPNCRAFVSPSDRECEYCGQKLGATYAKRPDPSMALRGLVSQEHFTTFIILLLNFGLFIATLILTMKRAGGSLSLFGGIDPEVLYLFGAKFTTIRSAGEWWRLVTAGFLHGGLFHILMNSWVLFDLGARVEEFYGTSRYLVIYFLSSVFGFWVSLLWRPFGLSIGASAAACGLIGAMMAYGRKTGSSMIWSFYLRWAIYILIIGLLFPIIDNAAHIGGGVAGFAIGWVAGEPRYRRPSERLWNAAAAVAVLTVALSFMLAYQGFSEYF